MIFLLLCPFIRPHVAIQHKNLHILDPIITYLSLASEFAVFVVLSFSQSAALVIVLFILHHSQNHLKVFSFELNL